jgi:glycosyltransferase involved in cell wall biosynthesis
MGRMLNRVKHAFFGLGNAPDTGRIIERARQLRRAGSISEAAKLLETLAFHFPRDIELLKELANARFALKDDKGVLQALAAVEAYEPLGPFTLKLKQISTVRRLVEKSQELRKADDVQGALSLLESALLEHPDNASLLKAIANAKFQAEDYEGVVAVLNRAKTIDALGDHSSEIYARARRLQRIGFDSSIHYYIDPEAPERLLIDEMVDCLSAHDVISFDIFDTAIVRAVSQPSHVFRIMGSLLQVTDFASKRRQAEAYARTSNDRLKGTREVTLDEIYEVLAARHGDVTGWKELEQKLEIQLTRPNPYIRDVFDRLRAAGKRLIFTSDMYLPRTTLEAMLSSAGYLGHETIYLSNEHAARKGDGTLQGVLIRDFGKDISIAHVGDVYDADVVKSNAAGITGVFNPDQHGLKREVFMSNMAGSFYEAVIDNTMGTGTWREELHYTHGFRVGGILALGYLEFIERLAREKGAEKILFLGRDCDILNKLYNRFFSNFPSAYVDTSRTAALMLTSEHNYEDYISRSVFRWFRESQNTKPVFQILEDAGFGFLVGHLEAADIEPYQFPASASEDRLRDFFWANQDVVEEHLSETKRIACDYFRDRIGHARTVLAVDIGWTGTCISTLDDFLKSRMGPSAPRVFGALLGTSRSDQITDAVSDGSITAYIYSPLENQDLMRVMMPTGDVARLTKDLLTHSVEYLFTEPVATTITYVRDDRGKPVAKRGTNVPPNVAQILEMQRGMLDFVERYLDYSKGLESLRKIGSYTAFQPLRNSLGCRPYQHAVYGDFIYDALAVLHDSQSEFRRFGDLFPPNQRSLAHTKAVKPIAADRDRQGILFVSHEMKYDGAPHSLLRLCKVANALGYRPVIWTERAGPFSQEFAEHGFVVRVVPPGEVNNARIAALKSDNIALVVCNTVATDRYVSAFEGKIPLVWYVREAGNVPQFLRGNLRRAATLAQSSAITVVSDYAANAIAEYAKGPVDVLHNAVEDYAALALPYRPQKDGVVRFVQLGTIEHRKGYDVLIAAYRALPDAYRERSEVHFAGGFINSGTSFASYLFGMTKDLPGVRFHGLIADNTKKIELMSQMDVVVVASRDESCSLVALEGAMLAKPLIVTENVGAKYMVAADNGCIVAPGDVAELSAAMMAMIDKEPDALLRMGAASRSRYEAEASMERHSQDLERLFQERIDRGAKGPLAVHDNNIRDISSPELLSARSELIVSLTSFPARMPVLAPCLKALKKQSQKPDRIILWLSRDQFPGGEADVPQDVLDELGVGLELRWVSGDIGPHKKYFYALQEYPDAIVVTTDDDIIYDSDLLAALYQGHVDQPRSVVAGRCNLIRFRPDGTLRTYDQWSYDYQFLRESQTYALLPTGIGGVLYPPGALRQEAFDLSGIEATCLFADDLWLKVMSTANGFPVWMPRKRFTYRAVGGSQAVALWRQNSFRGGNDTAFAKVIDYVEKKHGFGESTLRRIWGVRDDGTWVGPGDQLSLIPLAADKPRRNASAT